MNDIEVQFDRVNESLDRLCVRYKNLLNAVGYLQIKPCSESTPTAMTDGFCITFNPDHVATLSNDALDTLMMHEIVHIIDWHFSGSEGKDPFLWNICCDFRVNSVLRQAGMNIQPLGLDNPRYDGMTAEDIYKDLETMRKNIVEEINRTEAKVSKKLRGIKGLIDKENDNGI